MRPYRLRADLVSGDLEHIWPKIIRPNGWCAGMSFIINRATRSPQRHAQGLEWLLKISQFSKMAVRQSHSS